LSADLPLFGDDGCGRIQGIDDGLAREAFVNWQNCDLVDIVAGKQGGVPRDQITALLVYADEHKSQPVM
jgi:hypothetical protein